MTLGTIDLPDNSGSLDPYPLPPVRPVSTSMGSSTTAPERGWPAIHAIPRLPPLIGDYRQIWDTFTWLGARTWLDGPPGGAILTKHAAERQTE